MKSDVEIQLRKLEALYLKENLVSILAHNGTKEEKLRLIEALPVHQGVLKFFGTQSKVEDGGTASELCEKLVSVAACKRVFF